MDFEKILKQKRPNLSDSSIKTYASLLKSLKGDINKPNQIKKELSIKDAGSRKTIFSALFVATEIPEYKKLMISDIGEYKTKIEKQELSEEEKKNWATQDEIKDKLNIYKRIADGAYKDLEYLMDIQSCKDFTDRSISKLYQKIQDYLLLALTSGIYIPPRRSKDWINFSNTNTGLKEDNYISGNNLIFNSYKGSEKKGRQIIPLPSSLKTIMKKWIKYNPTDYLLFDSEYQRLTNVKLTQRLNKIFKKKASVNVLRHSFLTDKHKDTVKQNETLKRDIELMGSSILQSKVYIKNNV
jgi:hypothetical protein